MYECVFGRVAKRYSPCVWLSEPYFIVYLGNVICKRDGVAAICSQLLNLVEERCGRVEQGSDAAGAEGSISHCADFMQPFISFSL